LPQDALTQVKNVDSYTKANLHHTNSRYNKNSFLDQIVQRLHISPVKHKRANFKSEQKNDTAVKLWITNLTVKTRSFVPN